jgi:hypothetical protein
MKPRFDAVILDDIGYAQQSREEMEVLFTFLAEPCEKRTVIIISFRRLRPNLGTIQSLVCDIHAGVESDGVCITFAVDRLRHPRRLGTMAAGIPSACSMKSLPLFAG